MVTLVLTVLTFEVILINLLEKILYRRYINPFSVLSIPYLIIIFLTVILGPGLGFFNIYYQSVLIWIVGLIIFWIPGVLVKWFFLKNRYFLRKPFYEDYKSDYYENSKKWMILLSWIALITSVIGFIVAVNKFGISEVGSESFIKFYGGGISGHALVFNMIPFIFLVGIVKKNDWFIFLTLSLIFITFFLYQVKGWVLIPLISGLLLRNLLSNLKFNLKSLLYILGGFVIIFFTIYFLSIGTNFPFLKRLFFEYLFSGTIGLSEHMHNHLAHDIDSLYLINPFRNIYNLFTGNELKSTIQDIYLNIYPVDNISKSNVRTLFGTIFLKSTPIAGTLFTISFSLMSYFLYNLFLNKKNIWIGIMICFIMGGLFMGWFDIYFNSLNYYEIPLYIVVFMLLSEIKLPVF